MKLSRGVLSLLTVGVIFAGVGGAVAWRLLGEDSGAGGTSSATPPPSTEGVAVAEPQLFQGAQAVQGVEVVRDTLWIQVAGSGTAEAYRRSTVATRRAGVVEGVFVRENDFVAAGEVLIQLDTLEAALELSEARADLTLRKNDFQARMLAGGPVDDPGVLAQREQNIRLQVGIVAAESRLRRAEVEMELTRVTAPFSGRVADLKAVEGQYLGAGAEVLTLVQLDPIRIQVGVLESGLPSLSAGRSAEVQFSALPGERFTARIESVNPLVDREAGGMGRVTLVLPNPGGRVLPGMYAEARLDAESLPDRILVPREAILDRNSGANRRQIVFMARNLNDRGEGIAEWRYVTTGQRNERFIEIVAHEETFMLEPGEVVLVDGHHYLAHDTPVRLVDNVFLAGGRPGR
ncbi:MAG: efflux RND transporter periplasmic adaptor subunit [Gemmatimonadota bacterium]